ncbi:MAG: hypothetical protein GVY24_08370 [Planctomycetes bacterium]|jgi:hypothetical protein|nr:hypothetical protein [Planctomycetota bacterium]
MKLLQLLYISQAATPMDSPALMDLLAQCHRNNRELGLTGLLMYSGGHFIQLLEGDPASVCQMYERIRRDRRHTNVRLLMQEPAHRRIFDRWRMGLLNMDDGEALDRERLFAVCRELEEGKADARSVAVALLNEFRHQLPAPVGTAAA